MHNFRRILTTILAFALTLGLVSAGLMEVYFRSEPDFFQDGSVRDALAGTLDCLYCGASQAHHAFKPTVIDPILGTQSYSIAGTFTTMQGRYELIRQELERNPVKRIYFEVSKHTMSRNRSEEGPEGDIYLLARLAGTWQRTRFFLQSFSVGEYPVVYQKFLSKGIDTSLDLLSGKMIPNTEQSRGYLFSEGRSKDFEPNSIQASHSGDFVTQIDPDNLAYLNKILTLCKAHKVEVVLVMTPLSRTELFRKENAQFFYDWYHALAQREGLQYYDFNLLRDKEVLFPDETMYYDALHFNDEGATQFSRVFAELMLRADSGEDLSGLFYSSYQEMEQAVLGG